MSTPTSASEPVAVPDRAEALVAWYRVAGRDLPWRRTRDPWHILVSEVMLQQTQVDRVTPRYRAFLNRFPTVETAAAAPLADLIAEWSGLGYNARVRRLHEAAVMIAREGWPEDAADLRRLPGVGPYTAAAVASFAFGEQIAVVDTNVRRVLSRWAGQPLDGASLTSAADTAMSGDAATWNQAIMDLGATVCRPRPDCAVCPVPTWCRDPSIYVSPPRQSRFEGSTRQIRGAVVRSLVGRDWTATTVIADLVGHDANRTGAVVDALVSEGLVERRADRVRLPRGASTLTR